MLWESPWAHTADAPQATCGRALVVALFALRLRGARLQGTPADFPLNKIPLKSLTPAPRQACAITPCVLGPLHVTCGWDLIKYGESGLGASEWWDQDLNLGRAGSRGLYMLTQIRASGSLAQGHHL